MLQDDDESGAKMSKKRVTVLPKAEIGWNFGKYGCD